MPIGKFQTLSRTVSQTQTAPVTKLTASSQLVRPRHRSKPAIAAVPTVSSASAALPPTLGVAAVLTADSYSSASNVHLERYRSESSNGSSCERGLADFFPAFSVPALLRLGRAARAGRVGLSLGPESLRIWPALASSSPRLLTPKRWCSALT